MAQLHNGAKAGAGTDSGTDTYLLFVLGGMEKFIVGLIEQELTEYVVELSICSSRAWFDRRGVAVSAQTENDAGCPIHSGSAGCGKLILSTNAPAERIATLPYCQAALALIYSPMDIEEGGNGVPLRETTTTKRPNNNDCSFKIDNTHQPSEVCALTVAQLQSLLSDIPPVRWKTAVVLWLKWARYYGNALPDHVASTFQRLCNEATAVDSVEFKYRASCVRDGKHSFKSIDILPVLGDVIGSTFKSYKVDLDAWDLEFVVMIAEEHIVVGLSLQHDRSFRNGKMANEPSTFDKSILDRGCTPPPGLLQVTLRPSTAAVMIRFVELVLSTTRPSAQVLVITDPFAGLGTIPRVASSLNGVLRYSIGGELDSTAVDAMGESRGRGSRSSASRCEVLRWDATNLPLRPGLMDAVVSDLPFGHRCLSSRDLARLYPAFVQQSVQSLAPGGILLALTSLSGPRLLIESLHRGPWKVPDGFIAHYPVNVGGMISEIVLAERVSGDGPGSFPPPPMTKKQRKAAKKAIQPT